MKKKNKITVSDLQRTVDRIERVLTTEEFRDKIRAICGLRPAPYYNPPANPSPCVRRDLEREAKR